MQKLKIPRGKLFILFKSIFSDQIRLVKVGYGQANRRDGRVDIRKYPKSRNYGILTIILS